MSLFGLASVNICSGRVLFVLKTKFVRVACTLAALFLVAPIYAAHNFPDYPVKAAADYAVKVERFGLTIGDEPVEDLKDQKTYFDMELTPRGLLPVFVVMQNGSSRDSFIFQRANVEHAGVPDQSVLTARLHSGSGAEANLFRKELQSGTLSPGTSAHGFLYVPVPKKGPREKIHLQIPITKASTNETHVFNLLF